MAQPHLLCRCNGLCILDKYSSCFLVRHSTHAKQSVVLFSCRRAVGSPLQSLGLYQRPELRQSFELYLDYLLYLLADPEFEAKLEADPRQRREYLAAVKRIEEEELATWRWVIHATLLNS